MQSKGCLQGNKTAFIATSVLLLFCLKMLLVWQNSSRMEAELQHAREYFGQRALFPHVLAKILPCALQNEFGPIWADLAQTAGRKWFVGSGGEGGAGRSDHGGDPTVPCMEFSHHTQQDWQGGWLSG